MNECTHGGGESSTHFLYFNEKIEPMRVARAHSWCTHGQRLVELNWTELFFMELMVTALAMYTVYVHNLPEKVEKCFSQRKTASRSSFNNGIDYL